jgi:exosome complex component RRP42
MNFEDHILRAIKENVRYDGRKKDEYREIIVETGVSKTAEGSARVKIGNTEVICGIKLGVAQPYPDTPDEGMLMVDVHLLPIASASFESGPPGIDAIELARVTDRGVRESKCVDMKKLCIVAGEKVWSVSIDICTLNADGNLFDAASLAAIAALKNTYYPEIDKDYRVNYKKLTKTKLPLVKEPIGVTVWKVGDELVVDPTAAEERVFDTRLTITTLKNNDICAMQKGRDSPITAEDVDKIIDIATKKAAVLRKHL